MKKEYVLTVILTGLIITVTAYAVPIGYCPGLNKLIDRADAIVILRIDRHLTDFQSSTFYSTHECYIYQTIKGNIPKNARINLQLMNTEASFATPYAHGSTHLMFLMKKATEDEPTDYRTLTFKGAQILLSPLGHEKAPEGKTIEQKIKELIKDSIVYQAKEHQKKQRFLEKMLGKQGMSEAQKQKDRVEWAGKCLADFKEIKPGMTRAEVEKLMPLDGGLQSFVTVRYLHPECQYLKIDVKFSVKRNPKDQNRIVPSRNDKVVAVSKPYIEYPYMD